MTVGKEALGDRPSQKPVKRRRRELGKNQIFILGLAAGIVMSVVIGRGRLSWFGPAAPSAVEIRPDPIPPAPGGESPEAAAAEALDLSLYGDDGGRLRPDELGKDVLLESFR
ncbi:MAG: hypothetical protein AAFZ18_38480, partial [Myxococcota bacterium]